jgi:predicted RNase H-like HicB family nuclease
MTTLISYQSSGGDQGRCDAKCYDAEWDECDCICGERNHGAGLEQATNNARELAESWVEQARANGQDITHIELVVTAMHEPLLSLGGDL